MDAIVTKHLHKTYFNIKRKEGVKGAFTGLFHNKKIECKALVDFSFTVPQGEILGFIGPNGSGKTTLIKVLTGIIQPTSGEANVLGYVPQKQQNSFKKEYALVMGQKTQLWWDLPAIDTFNLIRDIYNIDHNQYTKKLGNLIDLFLVKDLLNVQVRRLSLGERMKMELIASLLHSPRIMFLDEPTIGLDAIAQKQMRDYLKEVNQQYNTTILLTSHYMEDIKTLCKHVVLINKGSKVYDGQLEQLLLQYRTEKVVNVTFSVAKNPPEDIIKYNKKTPYNIEFNIENEKINGVMNEILKLSDIKDITIEDQDINDIISMIYQKEDTL